jgi:hypothetical protein
MNALRVYPIRSGVRAHGRGDHDHLAPLNDADLIIPVEPVEHSIAIASQISEAHGSLLLLDIDNPAVEVSVSWQRPLLRLGMSLLKREKARLMRGLAAGAKTTPSTVRHPVLQARYGKTLIPMPGTITDSVVPIRRANQR